MIVVPMRINNFSNLEWTDILLKLILITALTVLQSKIVIPYLFDFQIVFIRLRLLINVIILAISIFEDATCYFIIENLGTSFFSYVSNFVITLFILNQAVIWCKGVIFLFLFFYILIWESFFPVVKERTIRHKDFVCLIQSFLIDFEKIQIVSWDIFLSQRLHKIDIVD